MRVHGIFCWHTCVPAWHLPIYVAFRETFVCTAVKGNKETQIKQKTKKRALCSWLSFGGIFSWYRPERRRTGFYSEREKKRRHRENKRERERESSLNAAFDLQAEYGTVAEASDHPPLKPSSSPALLVSLPSFSDYRLSDGPASQRPELHQSRGFVLWGRPDWALHESVHPLHHRHTLRALLAPGGDRGGTEEEAVAETQSTKRETRSAAQRNVSKTSFIYIYKKILIGLCLPSLL